MKEIKAILLQSGELEFLNELEDSLDKKIPVLEHSSTEKFGFKHQNNHVTHLLLSNCEIEKLPDSIANLRHLEVLHLHRNLLKDLQVELKHLQNLVELSIGQNPFESLPNWIGTFTNLKKLYLFGLNLTEIPKYIFDLPLTHLALYMNKIEEIPKDICKLADLEEFAIGGNQVSQLPKEICMLPKLIELSAYNNKIETLPECIRHLSTLEKLVLNHNSLTELPVTLGELKNLSILTLNDNKIKKFPKTIMKNTQFKTFWIHNNPELQISVEIEEFLIQMKSLGSNIKF
ncbi:MAG: leucine-rich repeat domain-containing protein [Promethearchaeota archaeon]